MKNLYKFILLLSLLITTHLYSYTLDPYEWLENENSEETKNWLLQQTKKSQEWFKENFVQEFETRLRKIVNFQTVDSVSKAGNKYFYVACYKGHEQACLYVRNENNDDLILDPSLIPSNGILSLTEYRVNSQATLLAYGLSESGSDYQTWRFKNLETKQDLSDTLTEIKFVPPCWDQTEEGVYYVKYGDPNSPNPCCSICHHRLGTSQAEDEVIFVSPKATWVPADIGRSRDGRYIFADIRQGTSEKNSFTYMDMNQPEKGFIELFPIGISNFEYCGYKNGRFYFSTDLYAPQGRVISIDPQRPQQENWQEHFIEKGGYLNQAIIVDNFLVTSSLEDAVSNLKIFDLEGNFKQQIELPGMGKVSALHSSHDGNDFFYSYSDFTHPTLTMQCCLKTLVSTPFFKPEIPWNPEDYEIHQIFYPSKDHTLIPLFLVHKKNLDRTRPHPTILAGYGGFGVSVSPFFSPSNLLWMEQGGIFALANLRGGGEYGEKWHEAGMREKKQNVFDDFIAAAEWLIKNGYTTKKQLGITGRSNGGLLVGVCVTQRPDLFGAAVPQVGLYDMLNFHRYTMGWAWREEYGDPDNPDDMLFLYKYSPYHHVPRACYPPILITTSDHDNRVVPLHSYKFAMMLQAKQQGKHPILLRIYENAGHGAGRSVSQRVREECETISFMWRHLAN